MLSLSVWNLLKWEVIYLQYSEMDSQDVHSATHFSNKFSILDKQVIPW